MATCSGSQNEVTPGDQSGLVRCLKSSLQDHRCYHCFKTFTDPLRTKIWCTGCNMVCYCSQDCLQLDLPEGHLIECYIMRRSKFLSNYLSVSFRERDIQLHVLRLSCYLQLRPPFDPHELDQDVYQRVLLNGISKPCAKAVCSALAEISKDNFSLDGWHPPLHQQLFGLARVVEKERIDFLEDIHTIGWTIQINCSRLVFQTLRWEPREQFLRVY